MPHSGAQRPRTAAQAPSAHWKPWQALLSIPQIRCPPLRELGRPAGSDWHRRGTQAHRAGQASYSTHQFEEPSGGPRSQSPRAPVPERDAACPLRGVGAQRGPVPCRGAGTQ
ncbi:hypothetical protein NDU88_000228 [Pleurodeles waltl]|uniref:Uncharacterized protein n=1 Tax=Pleurodeles waltl TaxID=8319 RepID=A0AAV7KLP8_PLEWA|nr:hypothetical protein NDU88_000228 [Pleurodeles waltl]